MTSHKARDAIETEISYSCTVRKNPILSVLLYVLSVHHDSTLEYSDALQMMVLVENAVK